MHVPTRSNTRPPVLRLALAGDLDMATRDAVRNRVVRALRQRPASIELDLTGVTFIDSAGLCGLLRSQGTAEAGDCHLVVSRLSPAVDRFLALTGTNRQLTRPPVPV